MAQRATAALREFCRTVSIEKSVHDLKRAVGLLSGLDITLECVKDDTFLAAYLIRSKSQ